MTKFTPKQLALLEKKIEFTEDGFNIVGDLPGSVLGNVGRDVLGSVGRDVLGIVRRDVLGNVGRNVWGSVEGKIGHGWVRKEPDNNMAGVINVETVEEHDDGSATVVFECDDEARKALINEGLISLLEKTVSERQPSGNSG